MVKNLLLALFIVFSISIYAQSNIDYSQVKLEVDEDFKNAEPIVVNATDYILSNPVNDQDVKRLYAIQFVMAWMQGTPDYDFSFDALDKLDDDITQTTAYIASLAKSALDSSSSERYDPVAVRNQAWEIFLNYSKDPKNNIKAKNKLQKMLKAYSNGQLEQELNK